MMSRSILGFVGALSLSGLLAACAGGPPISPEASRAPIGAVRVAVERADGPLERLAPLLADNLKRELGPQYSPGAGGVLTVRLTAVGLPNSADRQGGHGRVNHGSDNDELEGVNVLQGAGGRELARWPLLTTKTSAFDGPNSSDPSDARLNGLARAYAYWVAKKLTSS